MVPMNQPPLNMRLSIAVTYICIYVTAMERRIFNGG